MHSFKEQQGEIRKTSSMSKAKKWRKTVAWERLEISLKLETPRENFMQRWAQRTTEMYGPNRSRRY